VAVGNAAPRALLWSNCAQCYLILGAVHTVIVATLHRGAIQRSLLFHVIQDCQKLLLELHYFGPCTVLEKAYHILYAAPC